MRTNKARALGEKTMRDDGIRKAVPTMTVALVLWSLAASGQWTTQTIPLEPGWNAVFLEVDPEPNATEAVAGAVPVESIWAWNGRSTIVQYIQDPETLVPEQPDWLTYFPPTSPHAHLTDLHILVGGRPYLVKLSGTGAVDWEVMGKPVVRPKEWLLDSFNLVGFGLAEDNTITIGEFFAPSSAQVAQHVHALAPSGRWTPVAQPAQETLRGGVAYWVYSSGVSEYDGLLRVAVEDNSLDFGRAVPERKVTLYNERSQDVTVTLAVLPSETPPEGEGVPLLAGPTPLSYFAMDLAEEKVEFVPLEAPVQFTVPASGSLAVRLGVRRADMAAYEPPSPELPFLYQSILEITDGLGTRHLVPVSAEGLKGRTYTARDAKGADDLETLFADVNAGLWQGRVAVNKVSEPYGADPAVPKPTAMEFEFPIIVHVDNEGQARLLQQVAILWKDGTRVPDPEDPDYTILDEPGRFVLVTDESLVSQYQGSALRDGQQVGRRISSTAFSHREPADLAGAFGGTLACELTIPYNDPLNPFKHRYHPDHNMERVQATIAADGAPSEWFTVRRQITLEFSSEDPEDLATTGWGDSVTGGVYRETLIGIHKEVLYVEGIFRLNRIMHEGRLNDE